MLQPPSSTAVVDTTHKAEDSEPKVQAPPTAKAKPVEEQPVEPTVARAPVEVAKPVVYAAAIAAAEASEDMQSKPEEEPAKEAPAQEAVQEVAEEVAEEVAKEVANEVAKEVEDSGKPADVAVEETTPVKEASEEAPQEDKSVDVVSHALVVSIRSKGSMWCEFHFFSTDLQTDTHWKSTDSL